MLFFDAADEWSRIIDTRRPGDNTVPKPQNKAPEVIRWTNRRGTSVQHTLTLGRDYLVSTGRDPRQSGWKVCRFIKTTPKGFNLLNLDTSKCVSQRHYYTREFQGTGITVPQSRVTFEVYLPDWVTVRDCLTQEKQA